MMPILRIPGLLILVTATLLQPAAYVSANMTEDQFHQNVDTFIDQYFEMNPANATEKGFHQYDTKIGDYSKNGIKQQIEFLKRSESLFESFHPKALNISDSVDLELLIHNIKGSLLELQEIRQWQTNPDYYSSEAIRNIFVMITRKFASADERLKLVIEREKQIPKIFQAAKENLKNPPRIYTEVALEQLPGIISFFRKDIPAAFTDSSDERLLAEFNVVNEKVIDELERYQKFVKALLPKSKGDFRLGKKRYQKKLLYDEMEDASLDELLKMGYANLHRNQQALRETAKKIDSHRPLKAVLSEIVKDHPSPNHILDEFRGSLSGLRKFLIDHKIVTVPSSTLPIVQETPPFLRALTLASMDTPGPYENKATESYLNVTLPEASWSPKQVEEHLEGFNRSTIVITAAHEVFPGHFTQLMWLPQVQSKVRKLFGSDMNREGWAHYTEQMILEEGYRKDDLKLKLGQLLDALLRNARYIVGIQMHTGKMTYKQGIDFFVKEGFQPRAIAERETKRGTSDPTYLMYTLGKLRIYELRDEYKAKKGDKFSLQQFHDEFLQQGYPPIRLLKRLMLPQT